jgi:type IV pilus assembly protein PilO
MKLEDLKENKTYQISGAIIAGYIVMVILFYFILIAPKVKASKDFQAKIAEKQTFISKAGSMDKQREKIENAKDEIGKLKENINYYEKKLPTEKDIPDLLQYLSNIGTETNVKLLEIEKKQEIRQEQGQTLYVTVPFKLILKGGYHNIGSFIGKLENADRFMKIEKLEIKEDKNNPYEHRGEMTVFTYILDTQEPAESE